MFNYILEIYYSVWSTAYEYFFDTEQAARDYAKRRIQKMSRHNSRPIYEIVLLTPELEKITLYKKGE